MNNYSQMSQHQCSPPKLSQTIAHQLLVMSQQCSPPKSKPSFKKHQPAKSCRKRSRDGVPRRQGKSMTQKQLLGLKIWSAHQAATVAHLYYDWSVMSKDLSRFRKMELLEELQFSKNSPLTKTRHRAILRSLTQVMSQGHNHPSLKIERKIELLNHHGWRRVWRKALIQTKATAATLTPAQTRLYQAEGHCFEDSNTVIQLKKNHSVLPLPTLEQPLTQATTTGLSSAIAMPTARNLLQEFEEQQVPDTPCSSPISTSSSSESTEEDESTKTSSQPMMF